MMQARRKWSRTALWGLAAALVLLGPRAALAGITAGPAVDVPWLAEVDFDTVSAAVLEDGSFAIAGSEIVELSPQSSSALFVVQFFDSRGTPKGEPVSVFAGRGAAVGGVGSLGDHYFVVWSLAFPGETRAAFFDESGKQRGRSFSWPVSATPIFHKSYRYGQAPSWSFLPIIYYQNGLDPGSTPFYEPTLQLFGSDAQPLGPASRLAAGRRIYLEDAAVNGTGSFVVLSTQCSRDFKTGKPCVRGIQLFDGSGLPTTPFLTRRIAQLVSGDATVNGRFSAAIGPPGEVLLTWVTGVFQPVSRLVARLYDPLGSAASAVLPVAEAGDPGPIPLPKGAQALDDGNFVLAWDVYSPSDRRSTIFLRELATTSLRLAEPVSVATGFLAGSLFELAGSGHGVVVWGTRDTAAGGPVAGQLSVIEVK
jgi:hypothetical protein